MDKSLNDNKAAGAPSALNVGLGWQPIETAPKDGRTVLVQDTVLTDGAPFVAAYWLEGEEWQGWSYDDDIMCDCNPMGPQPKIWFDVPIPNDPNAEVRGCANYERKTDVQTL